MKKIEFITLIIFLSLFLSCAVPHHIQLSDFDDRSESQLRKFEVKVSEFGVDIRAVKETTKLFTKGSTRKNVGTAGDIISLFYMGPTTGNMVFTDKYADEVMEKMLEYCPTGKITGLTIVRETMSYPIISGEILKITGYCII